MTETNLNPETSPKTVSAPDYVSGPKWSATRPLALVVCCSDGRLQTAIDDFLHHELGVVYYDRLYAPGGPAALATRSCEFLRAETFRKDYQFLSVAHSIEQVIFIFHSAAEGGPEEAICAHYRRLLPQATREEIAARQLEDMAEVRRHLESAPFKAALSFYRAEVLPDRAIRFVPLEG